MNEGQLKPENSRDLNNIKKKKRYLIRKSVLFFTNKKESALGLFTEDIEVCGGNQYQQVCGHLAPHKPWFHICITSVSDSDSVKVIKKDDIRQNLIRDNSKIIMTQLLPSSRSTT